MAQGCPLSIMWANIVGALWSKILTSRAPDAAKNISVDDKSIRTQTREGFVNALETTAGFDNVCGLALKVGKIQTLATNKNDTIFVRTLKINGIPMPTTSAAVSLGAVLAVGESERVINKKRGLKMPELPLISRDASTRAARSKRES